MKNKTAGNVIETIYNDVATAAQRNAMLQEFLDQGFIHFKVSGEIHVQNTKVVCGGCQKRKLTKMYGKNCNKKGIKRLKMSFFSLKKS